jgi:glycerophosphoryl diester phosphodiesterase
VKPPAAPDGAPSRRAGRRAPLPLLAAVLLALAPVAASAVLGGPAHADQPEQAPEAQQAQQAAPVTAVPLLADFDGDRRTDVFWYGPGANPDHHWYGRSGKRFGGIAADVAGTFQPLTGDFDGDARADIFWYGPGGGEDGVWFGTSRHGFTRTPTAVTGTYEPITGDFDGDRRTDILWYGRGAANDGLWYGRRDRRFSGKKIDVDGGAEALTGDFDGDRRTDILWYVPGGTGAAVWFGQAARGFTGTAVETTGTAEPLVGDFDGDGRSDVFWYGPGAAADTLWYGREDDGFTATEVTVDGDYRPFVGDFDGDRRSDVFWYAPGRTADAVWYGGSDRGFSAKGTVVTLDYRPMVGDFDGDGDGDVLWYAPGPADDTLWYAAPGRTFSSRPTTIDLDDERAAPLVQRRLVEAYDPFGYIAHANGGIAGHTYTNSLEAFERNYARGFRVFEIDFVRLADGTVFAAHDGLERSYALGMPFRTASWANLAGHKFDGKYTTLRSQDVVQLLRDHPDAYVVLDTKEDHFEIFRTFVAQTGRSHELMDRIIPHIKGQADLDQYRTVWPLRNYLLALYRTQFRGAFDDAAVLSFVRNNRAPGVMMWWKDRLRSLTLAQNSRQQRRYSPAFARALHAAGAVAFVHSIADVASVARYEAAGVGIYSNEPFATRRTPSPQRARGPEEPDAPAFPPDVIPA